MDTHYDNEDSQPLIINAPPVGNRPPVVVYCDFDGVLNQLLYREVPLSNPDTHTYEDLEHLPRIPRIQELSRYDNTTYGIDYYEIVREAHKAGTMYTHSQQKTVPFTPSKSDKVRHLDIIWSPEMIDDIREMIEQGLIEFRWCTTWNKQANDKLSPLLGLPISPQVPLNPPGFFDRNWNVEKYWWVHDLHSRVDPQHRSRRWVQEVYNEHGESILEDTRPFIWIDDIATLQYENQQDHEQGAVKRSSRYYPSQSMGDDMLNENHLIMRTDAAIGISRPQMENIRRFVTQHA